jgi:hypothetical protein
MNDRFAHRTRDAEFSDEPSRTTCPKPRISRR